MSSSILSIARAISFQLWPSARHVAAFLSIGLILGLTWGSASAERLYRSVGPDGRVMYSDQPPSDSREVRTLDITNLPSTPVPGLKNSAVRPPQTAASSGSDKVTLFAVNWCGYCKKAKAYLAEKRIPYREINTDTAEGKSAYRQAGGEGGVPLLLAGDKRLKGFSRTGYDAFFADMK
jgi:glutaredoxin